MPTRAPVVASARAAALTSLPNEDERNPESVDHALPQRDVRPAVHVGRQLDPVVVDNSGRGDSHCCRRVAAAVQHPAGHSNGPVHHLERALCALDQDAVVRNGRAADIDSQSHLRPAKVDAKYGRVRSG